MKRIYIIIAGAFLILLVIISVILSFQKKSATNNPSNSPFPTSIPFSQSSTFQLPNPLPNPSSTFIDISTIEPVETTDFKLQYSFQLNKIVVEKKTSQAEEQFINWAGENQLYQLIENPELTLIVDQGKNPDDFNPLLEFLNIFMNFGQGIGSSNSLSPNGLVPNPSSSPPLVPNSLTPNPSFTYFPQCGEFGNTSLPNGCNLCKAGCGPTTVAMIAASYLGEGITPKTIVDIYQSKGYFLGCTGSYPSNAKQVFQSLGLKTTDYLIFNLETADQIVPDLRKYIAAGWTFFTLARFCDDPKKSYCGHIFWITDIDSQDNIWAYDPAYGRYEIPYNENSRYPYPLYRLAFGVKR